MDQRSVDEVSPPRPESTLDRIRANRTGRVALKTGVGLAGAALIAIGLVLVPLPGPGWLIVLAGLAVLAIEFAWAKHLLRFTRRQLRRWTTWLLRRPLPVRLGFGAAGIVLVAFVIWVSVRMSFGIDLAVVIQRWFTG